MAAIDYKDLLWKYMNHVGDSEGVTFLSGSYLDPDGHAPFGLGQRFTREEMKALEDIDAMPKPVGEGWRS